MDKHFRKFIDSIQNISFNYLRETQQEFGLSTVTLTFYRAGVKYKDVDPVPENMDASMYTVSQAYMDDDSIIRDMTHKMYMTYESLYRLIIECRLDGDKIVDCMKFRIRHELGHIIADRRKYIDTPHTLFQDDVKDVENQYSNIKQPRKNARYEKLLEWSLMYNFDIPMEREANDAVGITREDVIEEFERTHQK